ncbi:unnamed protein product [Cuscuta campestris]|uniref:Uncharacterized protein n=1 Tax=Cuscuta campestris TaxID=132261 RepID=A0A484ML47_9ASTE|nr:unnamed protein product [Cuscuta campestris]
MISTITGLVLVIMDRQPQKIIKRKFFPRQNSKGEAPSEGFMKHQDTKPKGSFASLLPLQRQVLNTCRINKFTLKKEMP